MVSFLREREINTCVMEVAIDESVALEEIFHPCFSEGDGGIRAGLIPA